MKIKIIASLFLVFLAMLLWAILVKGLNAAEFLMVFLQNYVMVLELFAKAAIYGAMLFMIAVGLYCTYLMYQKMMESLRLLISAIKEKKASDKNKVDM